jgi:hypothetical protein
MYQIKLLILFSEYLAERRERRRRAGLTGEQIAADQKKRKIQIFIWVLISAISLAIAAWLVWDWHNFNG